MKLKNYLIAAICAFAASTQIGLAAPLAALPKFKSQQELASEKQNWAQVNKNENATTHIFYTGKTFESDQEVFLFKYRNYKSEVSRWTTIDPIGFPDGANNMYYAPVPTLAIDPTGASSWKFSLPSTYYGDGNHNIGSVSVSGNPSTLTVDASWSSDNYYSDGLTSASLSAEGNAWLNGMSCSVNLSSINISINETTGVINVTQGNSDPSTNDQYLGLGHILTVDYTSNNRAANIIYKTSGIYSGGGFTGGNASAWGFGGGGSWANSSGSAVETTVSLIISAYE